MTKRASWVAFDVESERLSHEVSGGWDNPFGFGFTVGCTTDHKGVQRAFSTHNSSDARARLLDYLLQYDRVVSFNGLRFDNGVVAGDNPAKLALLDERTWDLKVLLDKACGLDSKKGPHMISLDNLAGATLTQRKSMSDGRDAVKFWRKGDYQYVVDYCQVDADLTAEAYSFGLHNGYVLFEPSRVPIFFGAVAVPSNGGMGVLSSTQPIMVVKVPATWKS